jgi:hypothetical protein
VSYLLQRAVAPIVSLAMASWPLTADACSPSLEPVFPPVKTVAEAIAQLNSYANQENKAVVRARVVSFVSETRTLKSQWGCIEPESVHNAYLMRVRVDEVRHGIYKRGDDVLLENRLACSCEWYDFRERFRVGEKMWILIDDKSQSQLPKEIRSPSLYIRDRAEDLKRVGWVEARNPPQIRNALGLSTQPTKGESLNQR